MSDFGYTVGFATGSAMADLLNQRRSNEPDPKVIVNEPDPKEIVVKIGPDLSQIEKDKDKPNLGKLFPPPVEDVNPDHQVNPDAIAITVAEGAIGTVPVFDDSKLRDRDGLELGEEVTFTIGGQPSEEGLDPAKGLSDPSAVDQINQDLLLAQAAPAVQAGSGVVVQSGSGLSSLFGPVLSFLSIPFSSIMIWLAGTQDVADATLDNMSPEQLAQIQARMAHAGTQDDTLGGRLVYQQGVDGFLSAVDAETGERVIGPGGQILNPELLTALTMGYLGHTRMGDRIPGVSPLTNTNVVHIGEGAPFDYHGEASRHNRENRNMDDIVVVVDFVLRSGESALGYMRAGLEQIVTELLNLASIGLLPDNTSVDEILRRSGIETGGALTSLLTSVAANGMSPEDFVRQVEEVSQALQSAIVQPGDDELLPTFTITVEAEEVPGSREVEGPGPGDHKPQVGPDDSPFGGHL